MGLGELDIQEIGRLRDDGMTLRDIGRIFSVGKTTVRRMLRRTGRSCVIRDQNAGAVICMVDERLPMYASDIERFWKTIDTSRGDDNCWLWKGALYHFGYGRFGVYRGAVEARAQAHRVAWTLHNGIIPDAMLVCHACDVPSCCNPKHLFLGTQAQNIRDAALKGRLATGDRHWARAARDKVKMGESHPSAKLTAADVSEIRRLREAEHLTYDEIAARFGVSKSAVYSVIVGRSWRHLEDGIIIRDPDGEEV